MIVGAFSLTLKLSGKTLAFQKVNLFVAKTVSHLHDIVFGAIKKISQRVLMKKRKSAKAVTVQ